MLTLIREFQTLIVGVLGFAGVIFTLSFNAWQARSQRRDERQSEAESLRAALLEELRINLVSVRRNIDTAEKAEHGVVVPTEAMDDAYRSFINRIGFLSQEEVHKVMDAYLTLRTYSATLFLIGVRARTDDRYIDVPAKSVPSLLALLRGIADPIEQAIAKIEKAQRA